MLAEDVNQEQAELIQRIEDEEAKQELDEFKSDAFTRAPFEISETGLQEAIILTKLSVPLSLSVLIELAPTIIGIIYIGKLTNSAVLLSTVGSSRTLYLIVGFFLWGLLSALPTLIPQAMGAARNDLIALYMQRAFYLILIASVPCNIFLWFGGNIMSLLSSNNAKHINITNTECRYLTLALYAYVMLCLLQKLPQSINASVNFELLICCIVSSLCSFPFCYLFLTHFDWKYSGFALNITVCYSLNILLTLRVYYKYNLFYVFKPIPLYKIFAFDAIKQYLHLAIPGTIIIVFEALLYEFTVIYAGLIVDKPDIAVSSAVIIQSIMLIIQCIAMGAQYAMSIRIGKYIGNNMIYKAIECIKYGQILSSLLTLIIFAILLSFRKHIVMLYTNDSNIINLTSSILYITMINQIFYVQVYVGYGTFRGIGKPKSAALILLLSYYILPFPLMFVLLYVFNLNTYLLYGTMCIFITIGVGNFIAVIMMQMYLMCKLDWTSIIRDAQTRLYKTDLEPSIFATFC